MISYIRKRLELKIILTLTLVIACMIGFYAYLDIRDMRSDTIRTSERTLGAFAAAIKGSVNAAMKEGHHEDVRHILKEVNTPYFIDRVLIYSEEGRPLQGMENLHRDAMLDKSMPAGVISSLKNGDVSAVSEEEGGHFITYYSPIVNRPACHRCHGSRARLNGILRIDFSLRELDDLIALRRNRVLLWSVLLIVLLSGVLAALLRIVVYRPVKELRDAMMNVREGTDSVDLSARGSDELADLKKSFVNMLERITSLHRTNIEKEKLLSHNEEMLRFRAELQTMFDAMPDGVLLIGPDLRIIQSNPRVYELLPSLKTSGSRIPTDGPKDESCPHRGIERAFREETLCDYQCRVKLPEGRMRYVHSICAPIREGDRVSYVVEVVRDITERVRTERELEEKTAELVALNGRLSQLAIIDSLTGVYNRYRFDEILLKEVKRFSRRRYSSLSLMMIDIDRFKSLNDAYGHLAGDAVLREIAKLLREEVRETDVVARFGGEEFVIVMPDTSLEGAVHKAEALRKKTEKANFPGHAHSLRVTISIGVASYRSGSAEEFIHAADLALYRAKNSGRNAVVAGGSSGGNDV